jgi:hypothetical protein
MSKRDSKGHPISSAVPGGAAAIQLPVVPRRQPLVGVRRQPGEADDEMEPVPPQPQERIGAVAGGGIGGNQVVREEAIARQLRDLEELEEVRIQQIRAAIEAANLRRENRANVEEELRRLQGEQERVVREVRCLLPGPQGVAARAVLNQRQALMPLVDIFFDAFRPFLTEAYDNVANFRECFPDVPGGGGGNALIPDEQLLRNSFELLMKESIVQGISVPQTAITAFTQLLFGNSQLRMLVSAAGSIVAFILARDALCLFSSTVISVMTFGTLSLEQLTNLCVFVYYNCSLVNLRNLLIYFNVPVANAQAFIQAIRNFNSEQRQYIIMSLFLFGLNAINEPGIVADQVRDRINRLIEGARQYFPGDGGGRDPADGDNDVAGLAPPPANQAAAAQALNEAQAGIAPANQAAAAQALNQAQAGIAPAAADAPAQGPPNRSLLEIFGDQGIIAFINNILRNGWMRGLRITTSCLREVFRIYLPRQPHGQGLSFNLVDITGRIARWGVAAIQERSAVLDPAKPNQEVILLLAAVNGMDLRRVSDPAQCEAALYEFGRNLKGISVGPNNDGREGAVRILEQNGEDDSLVYLTEAAAPRCLHALRAYFRPNDAATVNVERLQNACLGMRLFVFEQGMRSNILAAAVGRRVRAGEQQQGENFDDTQNAVQASESVQSMEQFVLEDNDTVTKNLFGRVRLMLQAFGIFQGEQLGRIGVVIQQILPDEEPSVNPAQILARERHAARMPHKEHVKTAVRASIVASGLPEEQKQLIIERLMEIIDDMNFDEIQQYVVGANPGQPIPQTFLRSCQEFMNLPEQFRALQANAAAATAAVYSGLGRCAASLMNAAVVSSGAAADVARAGIGRVSGLFQSVFGRQAAEAAAVVVANVGLRAPPDDAVEDAAAVPGAAIIANIELVAQPQIPVAQRGLAQSQGGRSGSRKRSASRGTRRKGKQSSKKLKHKSRRYVRRRRSTRRKN